MSAFDDVADPRLRVHQLRRFLHAPSTFVRGDNVVGNTVVEVDRSTSERRARGRVSDGDGWMRTRGDDVVARTTRQM